MAYCRVGNLSQLHYETPKMTPTARARLKGVAVAADKSDWGGVDSFTIDMPESGLDFPSVCGPQTILPLLADLERMEGVVEAIRWQSEPKPAGAGYCNLPD